MNIEEKIRKAAAEALFDSFSKGELPPSYGDVDIYFKQGYLLGIKEAFRWIPVQERLPSLPDERKCMDVLIKYKSRCSKNPMLSVRIDTFGIPYDRNNPDFFMNQRMHEYEVTHWRPINLEKI